MHPTNWDLGVQPLRFTSGYWASASLVPCERQRKTEGDFMSEVFCLWPFIQHDFIVRAEKIWEKQHIHPHCFGLSWNAFGTKVDPEAGGQSCSCWSLESRWHFSITEPCAQHHVAWWLCEKQNTLLTLKEWQFGLLISKYITYANTH